MLRTRFTELLDCRTPLQSAAMPGIATPELVAAVADAGGLGMLGVAGIPAPVVASMLDDLEGRTRGVFGVNFLMPFLDPAALDVVAPRARLVEFFYGDPDADLVRAARAGGALVSWQVGSAGEARAAVGAGCDLVVAQGSEAGGHVRGTLGLLAVLSEVLEVVSVPVIAAGGIGSARQVAAALAAGASAVRVGTRFVASAESNAHPEYVQALIEAPSEDATLTGLFAVGWDAPHRVLRSAIEAARAQQGEIVGEVDYGFARAPVERFSVEPPTRGTTGAVRAMALYAGQSVGAVTRVQPAGEIVDELMGGAEELLKRAAPAGEAHAPRV